MKQQKSLQKNYYGYIFLAPFFITFLIFGLYPILYTLYLSFTKYDGFTEPVMVGIANYSRVFKDPLFYAALKNTVIMWLIGAIPQMIFAFLLAAIFHYTPIKGKGIYRAIYYVPRLVTAVSISALIKQFLNYPSGVVNQLLLQFGVIDSPINLLNEPIAAQTTVGIMHWWMFFGNTMVMVMAGMTGIPKDLYEAGKIDGASSWQMFWKITMPLLRPITLFVLLTSLIGGLQSFEVQQVLTGGLGAPQGSLVTVVMYMYNTGFRYGNFGYAGAIAYYLFAIIAVFSVGIMRNRMKDED